MTSPITADPMPLSFEEASASDCRCRHCATASRPRPTPRRQDGGRLHRAVRTTRLATTVLAGAGVVGLGLGAGTANAMPAPSGPGWDGSRYWFKNAAGDWRYTSHYNVYLQRTGGGGGGGGGTTSTDSAGIRQGWDGSVYWFRNAAGEWRYTRSYDTYLQRTGGGTPAPAPSPPPPSTGSYESALSYALAQQGKPYVWGGNGPTGFDCSGLVQQAYRRAGISLPRVADDQYRATTPVSGQPQRGDLIFWSGNGRVSGIHHVGIYLGDNRYLEAAHPGTDIRISRLNSGYYPDFIGRP